MKRILLLFSVIMLSCIALMAYDVKINGIYYNLDETNKIAEVTYEKAVSNILCKRKLGSRYSRASISRFCFQR